MTGCSGSREYALLSPLLGHSLLSGVESWKTLASPSSCSVLFLVKEAREETILSDLSSSGISCDKRSEPRSEATS